MYKRVFSCNYFRWLRSEAQIDAVMVGLQQVQEMRGILMACSSRLAQEDI